MTLPITPPSHTPYQWQNAPSTGTPLDAAHLEAAETDLVAYTQQAVAALDSTRTLKPTAVQTANYVVAPQDLACGDATGQTLQFTLPTAPDDGTAVGIVLLATASGNVLTYQTGGADVLYLPSGATSDVLTVPQQGVTLQYAAATHTWYLRASSRVTIGGGLQFVAQPASPFTAQPNQFVVGDTTSGPVVVNMPTAPAAGTQVGGVIAFQGLDANSNPNTMTFVAGGDDTFQPVTGAIGTGNPTSASISLPSQPVTYQYADEVDLWVKVSGTPVTALAQGFLQANTPIQVSSVQVAGVSGQTLPATTQGYKLTSGAPTTGTWNTGDQIVAVAAGASVLHTCTQGGTPGLWDGGTGTAPVVTYPTGVSNLTQTSATLNGSVNPESQVTTYHFEYGLTNAYGTVVPVPDATLAQADNNVYAVNTSITGLTAGTLYHFRLVATNSTGTTNGADQSFTTNGANPAPTVTYPGTPTTSITNTGATLNGLVNPNSAATTYQFEYGTTTAYGTQTPTSGSIAKAQAGVSNSVSTNSLPLTLGSAPTANGVNTMIAIVTTANDSDTVTPPAGWTQIGTQVSNGGHAGVWAFRRVVQSGDAAGYTFTKVNSNGMQGMIWEFSGVDAVHLADASATNSGTGTSIASASVSPTQSSSYVLIGNCIYGAGGATYTGTPTNSYTVEANGVGTKAEFLSLAASGTGATSSTDTISSSRAWSSVALVLEGGSAVTSVGSGSNPVAETATIGGLTAGTTYHWRLNGTNANGTTHGTDQSFATTASVTPPTIVTSAVSGVGTTVATLNGTVNPNSVNGTTYQWVYGTSSSYGSVSPASPGAVTNGAVAISVPASITGLTSGTLYHYALKATNTGGTYTSADQTFTTSGSSATPIFSLIPPTIPSWQGCHTANDGYDSITVVTGPNGRQCYQYVLSDGSTGLKETILCKGANPTNSAISSITYPPQWTPGASFWLSTAVYIPTHFPSTVNFFALHEIYGSPFGGSPGFELTISGNRMLLVGVDYFGTGNSQAGGSNYFYADFGTGFEGQWHDFLFQIQLNTLRVGDATTLTHNGISSQNIPNNDGWMAVWHSANNNAAWTLGSPVTLTATTPNNTFNPNYPVNPPPGAPANSHGINIIQPGHSWPVNGNGTIGLWTFTYTGGTTAVTANGGTITTYHDRVKCGFQQSDVT